jgi:DNA mismatch endonuclease (patch repair protein)
VADVLTKKQRSYCMSRIRARNTVPELALRRAAWASGLRYRVKNNLFGRPDMVFVSARVTVFVDGCFWHGCPIHSVKPKTRAEFWTRKIGRNIERDAEVRDALAKQGWKVLRFWEHEINSELPRVVSRISRSVERGLTRAASGD